MILIIYWASFLSCLLALTIVAIIFKGNGDGLSPWLLFITLGIVGYWLVRLVFSWLMGRVE